MDKKSAKKILLEHKDALEVLLESDGLADVKAEIDQYKEQSQEGAKAFKKSLLEKVKDLPVVEKISQLGSAGTVAISTAAVTQADLAKNLTEVFVAEVANDVVEERFEVPGFIDDFIDFHVLNDWGQVVIAEKIASVSELSQTSQPAADASDTTQETSPSSDSSSSESSSQTDQPQQTDKSQESQKTEQESKAESSSNNNEEIKSEPQEGPKEETEQSTQSSSETSTELNDVKALPIIETPFDPMTNDVSPHSSVRLVSPIL